MSEPECCSGCRWYKVQYPVIIGGEEVVEDAFGCSNPLIDSVWCLGEHRPSIKGLYYDPKVKEAKKEHE